jgi:hypothetical protein
MGQSIGVDFDEFVRAVREPLCVLDVEPAFKYEPDAFARFIQHPYLAELHQIDASHVRFSISAHNEIIKTVELPLTDDAAWLAWNGIVAIFELPADMDSLGEDAGLDAAQETTKKPMGPIRNALRSVEGFFRLMVGDTSMIPDPDFSPINHVATVDELLGRKPRKTKPPKRLGPIRNALRSVKGFLRLMVGDTSMIPDPDLSPLDHVPTVDELLGRKPRKSTPNVR